MENPPSTSAEDALRPTASDQVAVFDDETADLGDDAPLDATADVDVMSEGDASMLLVDQATRSPDSMIWQQMYEQQQAILAAQQGAEQGPPPPSGVFPDAWGRMGNPGVPGWGQPPNTQPPQQSTQPPPDQQGPWNPYGAQQGSTQQPGQQQPYTWPGAPAPTQPPYYPPSPGAPYGLDANGVPLPAPFGASPAAPYGVDAYGNPLPSSDPAPYGTDVYGNPLPPPNPSPYLPRPAPSRPMSMAEKLAAMRRAGPLHIPAGPESYDGQWRMLGIFLAPDPSEFMAAGYVLETSSSYTTSGSIGLPMWRLVTEAQAYADSPEYAGGGTIRMSGPARIVGCGSCIGAAAPVALVRPRMTSPRASSPTAPKSSAVLVRPTATTPARIAKAPITRVQLTPGRAIATVKLPSGARAAKIQVRAMPTGTKIPRNPYDGAWHSAPEVPPSNPDRTFRLVQRSDRSGARWRFIPLHGTALAASSSKAVAALKGAPRTIARFPIPRGRVGGALEVTDDGRVLKIQHEHVGGAMDPNAPRYDVSGNAARSSIANTSTSAHDHAAQFLVPGRFLNEMQAARYPAIIGHPVIGACACVPASELSHEQRQRVGDAWQDFVQGASAVDHVLDRAWQVARPFVPYGDTIDQFHRARMDAMYGNQGAGAARGAADTAITSAQDLTRRARKGDPSAQQQVITIKEAAARGDANAIRTWRVMVLVARDDDAQIASGALRTGSSSSSSSSSSPLGALGSLFHR